MKISRIGPLAVLAFLAFALALSAQVPVGWVQVTAANTMDAGVVIANGTVAFQPVNNNGQPISLRVAGGYGAAATAKFGVIIAAQTPGSGYSGSWACAVNGGTYTSQATCTATVSSGGLVFAVTSAGVYTAPPASFTFSGGTYTAGTPATVTPSLTLSGTNVTAGGAGYVATSASFPGCTGTITSSVTIISGAVTAISATGGSCPAGSTVQILGSGQHGPAPLTATVTNGAFAINVPDSVLAWPNNVCYNVTVSDNASGNTLTGPGYNCVQPAGSGTAVTGSQAWCTAAGGTYGGSCNFDAYPPNLSALVVAQTGPAGAPGATGPPGAGLTGWTSAGSGSSQVVTAPGVIAAGNLVANVNGENLLSLQWPLNDNSAATTVAGNAITGTIVGAASTSAVAATLNGQGALRLNNGTSGQYVQVDLGQIQPYEVANLWTKSSSNPVIPGNVQFGNFVPNPSGGWWYFGADNTVGGVQRWQATSINGPWTNETTVLTPGSTGAWDQTIDEAYAFYDPLGSQCVLFYRGYLAASGHQAGIATSSSANCGGSFTKGGTAGLWGQVGTNYDISSVILVGSTYYIYVNGYADHGVTNVYTSTNDLATAAAYPNNPIFATGTYCPFVWAYNGYYYMLISRDIAGLVSVSTPYAHGLALYRSTIPTFDLGAREYLGYAAVNDQSYDNAYLDRSSVPMTSSYQSTYSPALGSTLYAMYSGLNGTSNLWTQNLISTPLSNLSALPALNESAGLYYGGNSYSSYSFWVQFDSLTAGDPIFSVSYLPTAADPTVFAAAKTQGANLVLTFFLAGSYRYTTQILTTNTPYHIVLVNNGAASHLVYVNGALVGSFTQNNTYLDANYLYIGEGYGTQFLHGYVQDFRVFPRTLSAAEVAGLYAAGPDGGFAAAAANSGAPWSPTYYVTKAMLAGTAPFSGFEFWPGNAPPRAGTAADFQALTGYVPSTINSAFGDLACALAADTTIGAQSITGGTLSGSAATLTAASVPNYYQLGSIIGVTGATPSGLNGGPYTLTGRTTTSITFASTVTGSVSAAGTFYLWCGNQSNNAVSGTPYTFANTLPIGSFSATATYSLRAQLAQFTPGTVANPVLALYYGSGNELYLQGTASVQYTNQAGTLYDMAFDINAMSTSMLQTALLSTTQPSTSAMTFFNNSLKQPVTVIPGASKTFNLQVYFSAATAGNGILMQAFKESQ
jgi:hypothetical protein